jgi:hypothetical protein
VEVFAVHRKAAHTKIYDINYSARNSRLLFFGRESPDYWRARFTISISTLLVSAALRASRKNAMRAPRKPSAVFSRT